MGIFADHGQQLAAAAAVAPTIRVAVIDLNDGIAITGRITAELSETHVRLLCDDGLVFAVPKADLRVLSLNEVAP